jgi:prevent-host-death family protein
MLLRNFYKWRQLWYYSVMKKVSMHDLKQELASYVGEAADGAEIMITRHNKPIARLAARGESRKT